jgi:RNA polymerase sigma-70 factor, ECF subfamily
VGPVNAASSAAADELTLAAAAAAGSESAFAQLADRHRAELCAHCYRMLGSLHDAEDAVQEALLRAWRGLPRFEGRSSVRSWLFSVATNTALDVTRHRSRRELPADFGPAAGLGADMAEPVSEPVWLEPFPDRLLPAGRYSSPEARYEQRESIELAFVAALQGLPARQRAVFLLREVLGFSAAEIAIQLGTSVPSVTSSLQRARARVERSREQRGRESQQLALSELGDEAIRATARRYCDALERGDADGLIGMLTEDAIWSMPPIPTWFCGHAAIRYFLERWTLTDQWRHVPVRSNGQLAVACYIRDPESGSYRPAVIDVLTMAGEQICAVTAFMTLDAFDRPAVCALSGPELFARFGLPAAPR